MMGDCDLKIFKNIIITIFTSAILFGESFHVSVLGSDETGSGSESNPFASIQLGLNTCADNDTVIVSAGIYVENINWPSTMSINLIGSGSFDCIIDGDSLDAVINMVEYPTATIDTTTKIIGFTIQNGIDIGDNGGGIRCIGSGPYLKDLIVRNNKSSRSGGGWTQSGGSGGGIFISESNPILENLYLSGNIADAEGGGIYFQNSDPIIENVTVVNNTASSAGGGIYCFGNTFSMNHVTISGNYSPYVSGIFYDGTSFDMINSIIWENTPNAVAISTANEQLTISYSNIRGGWEGVGNIDSNPLFCSLGNDAYTLAENSPCYGTGENGTYMGAHDIGCGPVYGGPIWHVDALGSDQTADGSAFNPFLTIQKGILSCNAGDTVLVAAGNYFENIFWPVTNGIVMIGSGAADCIIDGYQNGSVIRFDSENIDPSSIISGFKIKNGSFSNGGGIFCQNSSPTIMDVIIAGNDATNHGGGITLYYSEPIIRRVTIAGNTAGSYGGGIYGTNSNPVLDHVTITDNSSLEDGGGIFCANASNLILHNSIVWGNNGNEITISDPTNSSFVATYSDIRDGWIGEGNIDANPLFCSSANSNYTLADNSPCLGAGENGVDIGAYGAGCVPIIESPIHYVSIDGSDETGDGSQSNPFATIQKGIGTSNAGDTVLVTPGVYSENIIWPGISGIKLIGGGESECTIDGNQNGSVIRFNSPTVDSTTLIRGFTLQNGSHTNGGGIYMNQSSPSIEHVTIINNEAINNGGGLTLQNSNPSLTFVTLANNLSVYGAGGIYCGYNSSPTITNVTVTGNSNINDNANQNFGGMYCETNAGPVLLNCSIWGNGGNEIFIPSNSLFSASYSNIRGGWEGAGNIDANPLFCDAENNDFNIAENSPCAGSGHNGANIGSKNVDCGPIYAGPVWYVATAGSDQSGDGSEFNPFMTIEKGINYCNTNDTVLVGPGTYNENIIWPATKGIRLVGSGETDCIIDGGGNERVLYLDGVDSTTSISNFKIQNGSSTEGGGIFIDNSKLTLSFLTVQGNNAASAGGPFGGGPDGKGGGIYCNASTVNINYLTITENSTNSIGGGICLFSSDINLNNVIINGNSANTGNEIFVGYNAIISISNSIVWGSNSQIFLDQNGILNAIYSNIRGNLAGEGNIDSNPLFCDSENGDFTLAENSPCLGTGENGTNMGRFGMGCEAVYNGPVWHISSTTGSDGTGDGSQSNPYLTIQKGINTCSSGDTVLMEPGVYIENIYWPATNGIKLIGSSEIDCIIDGNQNGSVISFNFNSIDSTTVLKGFRIQNGGSNNPMLPAGGGSGLDVFESSPTIINVTITNNSSYNLGGGINLSNSSPILEFVTITDNTSIDGSGGIYCGYNSNPTITNVTITGNTGSMISSGVYCENNTNPVMKNCILWGNDGIDLFVSSSASLSATYSIIRGGWEGSGNFDTNPLFCNLDSSNYGLADNSPCIGAGEAGIDIGAHGVSCGPVYSGPSWYASVSGSDQSGDGSEEFPFLTIQKALNSCNTADSVLVASGIYFENISWPSTNGIKLIGSGATETILDGSEQGTVVVINSTIVDTSTLITGFLIQNGATLFDNNYNSIGGGVYLSGSSPTIANLIIAGNSGSMDASGITLTSASPLLKNITITNNYTFETNAGALYCIDDANPVLQNCIIWGNHGGDIQVNNNSTLSATYSNIRGNWIGDGNIDANPLFCNMNIENYTLAENSPCVGSGVGGVNMGANDIGCGPIYAGPTWYVATTGSDQSGDGSDNNPFSTIQRGIDYCNSGDTVNVSSGTYSENINWPESNGINLIGSDDSECIINGNQNGSVILINSDRVDSNTVIKGFRIQNGDNYYGGGINLINASPTLENLTITNNHGTRGGGLSANSNIKMVDINITNNSSNSRGGGVHFNYSNASLVNVTVDNNSSVYGGGIYLNNSHINLENSGIVNNSSSSGGGGIYLSNSDPSLASVTLTDNYSSFGAELYAYNSNLNLVNSIIWGHENQIDLQDNTASLSATYSDIRGGWSGTGNIDSNPLFCNPDSANYSFAENSPCLGAGENGINMGSNELGCGPIHNGPVWHVSTSGSDEAGDGSDIAPYGSIQNALYSCNTGDTILVAEGTYNENLNWPITNGIKLIGSGPDNCILDGSENESVMIFNSSDLIDYSTVIEDFRIQNGLSSAGGGIRVLKGDPKFMNVVIAGNSSDYGGGIYCSGFSSPIFRNATITGNSSSNGAGIFCTENASPNLNSCIIWQNDGNQILVSSGSLYASFSNIKDGWEGFGNIEERPLFCYPGNDDYTIAENSPCVGSGQNGTNMGALDIGCDSVYVRPVFFVDISGSDETGDGSQANPFRTIQKGINETISGDTVFVSAGEYVENIIWPNRNIKLIGDGPNESIIDGGFNGNVIRFDGNNDNLINFNTIISGFTIQNGYSELGGGIYVYSSTPLFENLLITQNISNGLGGGIYCSSTSSNIRLTRSTIIDNWAAGGSGIFNSESNLLIENCIVWSDSLQEIGSNNGSTFIRYSNILGGWGGDSNINIDPLFCNPDSGDFTLAEDSPCVGTGESGVNMGAFGIGCAAILGLSDEFIPTEYALFQNYPNPFNPKTTIRYDIPDNSFVNLSVFDIMGRKIKTLVNEKQTPGRKTIIWNATNTTGSKVSASMYFYVIQAGEFRQTRKMVLLK